MKHLPRKIQKIVKLRSVSLHSFESSSQSKYPEMKACHKKKKYQSKVNAFQRPIMKRIQKTMTKIYGQEKIKARRTNPQSKRVNHLPKKIQKIAKLRSSISLHGFEAGSQSIQSAMKTCHQKKKYQIKVNALESPIIQSRQE